MGMDMIQEMRYRFQAYRQHYSEILKTRQTLPKYQKVQETIDKEFERYIYIAKSQCHDEIEQNEIKDILKTVKTTRHLDLTKLLMKH